MSETYKLEGFKELSKQLSKLGPRLGSKVLRSSLMSASLPVVKEARENVPKGNLAHKTHKGRLVAPGFAARNIARRSRLSRDKRTAFVTIGVKPEAYYAVSFLELGTKHIAKQPWLTRALESKQKEVISKLKILLKKKIDQEAKKRA